MKHLFIVGVGRSGTSLLQSMFAAHPSVAMLPETGILRRYVFGRGHGAATVHDARTRDHRLQRIPQQCWDAAAADVSPDDFLEVYRGFHRPEVVSCLTSDENRKIEVVGDKDPRLVEYLPAMGRVFTGDTYVIHIVRDPRDVLLSKIRAGWSEKRNWRANLAASRFQLALADRYGENVFGTRWITVRYEDLIADPDAVLRRLVQAIGLPYDPEMLRFSDAARSLSGGSIEVWKKETLGPLLSGNRDKWKTGLQKNQIDAVEGSMERWIDRFGYERSVGSRIRRLFYRTLLALGSMLYTARLTRHLSNVQRRMETPK